MAFSQPKLGTYSPLAPRAFPGCLMTLIHVTSENAAAHNRDLPAVQGDSRIATATPHSVRVWDNDGRLLVDIKVTVTP